MPKTRTIFIQKQCENNMWCAAKSKYFYLFLIRQQTFFVVDPDLHRIKDLCSRLSYVSIIRLRSWYVEMGHRQADGAERWCTKAGWRGLIFNTAAQWAPRPLLEGGKVARKTLKYVKVRALISIPPKPLPSCDAKLVLQLLQLDCLSVRRLS